MNTKLSHRNATAALMLSTVALVSLASVASADSGPWIRYKQGNQPGAPQTRVIVHENNAGPALAGFIGGLVIGSAIHSHPVYVAAPPPCPVAYSYYDPYCDQSFVSLDAYTSYWGGYDHPMEVRVIDARSGQWVNTLRFCEGGWRDDNWFRGPGRGHAYGHEARWSNDRGDERWSNGRGNGRWSNGRGNGRWSSERGDNRGDNRD